MRDTGLPAAAQPAQRGLSSSEFDLYMDGPAVFAFTLRVVPPAVDRVFAKAGVDRDAVDT